MPEPTVRKRNHKAPRQVLPVRNPDERVRTGDEVATGFDQVQALIEAQRCLQCKPPKCVPACPISTDIKSFIDHFRDSVAASASTSSSARRNAC